MDETNKQLKMTEFRSLAMLGSMGQTITSNNALNFCELEHRSTRSKRSSATEHEEVEELHPISKWLAPPSSREGGRSAEARLTVIGPEKS